MSPRRKRTAVVFGNASVFAALGDDTRFRVMARLCRKGPSSITGLTQDSGVTRQAVTKHLHVLQSAGLVKSETIGRETRWKIRPEGLSKARASLDRISAAWDNALNRLKDYVE